MNRVDRLLAQILLLQSKRVVTAEQMARYFELNIRTIYRDLRSLGEIGVPIVAEAGVGYTLLKGYHLPPVNLTPEEANALVTGGMLVAQFADASISAGMTSALAKVRAILPRDHQDRLSRLERGLAATAIAQPATSAPLAVIQSALSRRRVMQFDYHGGTNRTESTNESASKGSKPASKRLVEPMGLIYYLSRWHLIAWCRTREAYRDFRTDRMSLVTVRPESFTPRGSFDAAEFIRGTMPAPKLRARISFDPASADRARREWWPGIIDEKPIGRDIVITLAAIDWEMLARWLLSFGTSATVVAPSSLRNLLEKEALEIAGHQRKAKPAQPT